MAAIENVTGRRRNVLFPICLRIDPDRLAPFTFAALTSRFLGGPTVDGFIRRRDFNSAGTKHVALFFGPAIFRTNGHSATLYSRQAISRVIVVSQMVPDQLNQSQVVSKELVHTYGSGAKYRLMDFELCVCECLCVCVCVCVCVCQVIAIL